MNITEIGNNVVFNDYGLVFHKCFVETYRGKPTCHVKRMLEHYAEEVQDQIIAYLKENKIIPDW
jgi:hypothetical protein